VGQALISLARTRARGANRGLGVLFDPAEDGLDFYESLEGMLVQMNDLVATSFTVTNFGEIFVVGDNGANATTMTPRGGLVIGPGDLNPERMVIDDQWFKTGPPAMPVVNVGGTFPGAHVGIMDWAFGEYRIQLPSQPVVGSTGVCPSASRRSPPARTRSRSRRSTSRISPGTSPTRSTTLSPG
jgi:uncharacterized protein